MLHGDLPVVNTKVLSFSSVFPPHYTWHLLKDALLLPPYCPEQTELCKPSQKGKEFKRSVESRTKLVSNSPASPMDSFFPPPCPQVMQTPSLTAQRGKADSAVPSCVKGQKESALQGHPSPRVEPFLSRGGQGWAAHPCPALPAGAGKAALGNSRLCCV